MKVWQILLTEAVSLVGCRFSETICRASCRCLWVQALFFFARGVHLSPCFHTFIHLSFLFLILLPSQALGFPATSLCRFVHCLSRRPYDSRARPRPRLALDGHVFPPSDRTRRERGRRPYGNVMWDSGFPPSRSDVPCGL
jgi:hypothetical protein